MEDARCQSSSSHYCCRCMIQYRSEALGVSSAIGNIVSKEKLAVSFAKLGIELNSHSMTNAISAPDALCLISWGGWNRGLWYGDAAGT